MGDLEEALKQINTKCIQINDETRKKNVKKLEDTLELFVKRMREVNTLFDALYQTIFYGGSYYDNLKVGAPDEFDIDILLKLPLLLNTVIKHEGHPDGYISAALPGYSDFTKQEQQFEKFKDLKKTLLTDNDYLDAQRTNQWMQSIVDQVFARFHFPEITSHRKNGPAYCLTIQYEKVEFSIDLVPSFVFGENNWPGGNYRSAFDIDSYAEFGSNKFFIVPKPCKSHPGNRKLWRLSFQIQERNKFKFQSERLKSAIKLVKKLRDVKQHNSIKSYFIKTVALWEIEERSYDFWSGATLSQIFMALLKKLQACLEVGRIKYYWNVEYNLLSEVSGEECANISNNLKNTIASLENAPDGSKVFQIFKCDKEIEVAESARRSPTRARRVFSPETARYRPPPQRQEMQQANNNVENIAAVTAGVAALAAGAFAMYRYFNRNDNNN